MPDVKIAGNIIQRPLTTSLILNFIKSSGKSVVLSSLFVRVSSPPYFTCSFLVPFDLISKNAAVSNSDPLVMFVG